MFFLSLVALGVTLGCLFEIFEVFIFQFVGHPPSRYLILLYRGWSSPTISFFFVFGCRIYLLVSSSLFVVVDGCSAVSCDFGVSVRRYEFISCLCPKTILLFTRRRQEMGEAFGSYFHQDFEEHDMRDPGRAD